MTQSIGDIFLKLVKLFPFMDNMFFPSSFLILSFVFKGPWFRLYGPYVNNFDAATAMLKQLAKKPGWSAYVAVSIRHHTSSICIPHLRCACVPLLRWFLAMCEGSAREDRTWIVSDHAGAAHSAL